MGAVVSQEDMQCVILAGGLATRMRPLTEKIPKSLMPVHGKPFIDYQLASLAGQNIKRVTLIIGHLGEQIRTYVGDGGDWNLFVDYVDEGEELRGTGGALRYALDKGALDERFLLTYGDSFLNFGFAEMYAKAEQEQLPVLMMIMENKDRWDRSNVRFEANGRIFYSKLPDQPSNLTHIDSGVSVISKSWLSKAVPAGTKYDLADAFHLASQQGLVTGYLETKRFYEIGSPAGLEDFSRLVESRA